MGKPFQSGTSDDGKPVWSARTRTLGEDVFVSGKATAKEARDELGREVRALKELGKPLHGGPGKNSVAQALQRYAMARLPYMKGAAALSRDINRYLRGASLETLEVLDLPASEEDMATHARESEMKCSPSVSIGNHFVVRLQPADTPRVIPKGLHGNRKKLVTKSANSSRHRDVLATTAMADVTRHQIQSMFNAMLSEGSAAATVLKERSLLSPLFTHAKKFWHWSSPAENPTQFLNLPQLNNERDRVMSVQEEQLLLQAMTEARNVLLEPTARLLTHTAMRVGEAIYEATWADVNWDKCLLKLRDSKTGGREVPLSPEALAALRDIRALAVGAPQECIVSISYESLKAAFRRACERAGIKNLHLHDLRHTAATRLALKTGNVFLVKALTGHKTLSMVERYVNVSASDVVAVLHQQQPASLFAGVAAPALAANAPAPETPAPAPLPATVLPPEVMTQAMLQSVMTAAVHAAMVQLQSGGQPTVQTAGLVAAHPAVTAESAVIPTSDSALGMAVEGVASGTGQVIAFRRKRA